MSLKSLASAAAFCVLAATGALAQQPASTDAGRSLTGAPAQPGASQWPVVVNGKSNGKVPSQPWSQQEIDLARARCTALLKGLDAVVVAETPIREGTECGAAGPMKLVSVGKNPQP